MTSRRSVLRGFGTALVAAVAGCSAPTGGDPVDTPTQTETEDTQLAYTTEFSVRKHLYETYTIGTCFGMPSPTTETERKQTISEHNELALQLINEYDIEAVERLYTLVTKFLQIELDQETSTKFSFTIRDGQCCTMRVIRGSITTTGEILETTEETKTMPC